MSSVLKDAAERARPSEGSAQQETCLYAPMSGKMPGVGDGPGGGVGVEVGTGGGVGVGVGVGVGSGGGVGVGVGVGVGSGSTGPGVALQSPPRQTTMVTGMNSSLSTEGQELAMNKL